MVQHFLQQFVPLVGSDEYSATVKTISHSMYHGDWII